MSEFADCVLPEQHARDVESEEKKISMRVTASLVRYHPLDISCVQQRNRNRVRAFVETIFSDQRELFINVSATCDILRYLYRD